MCPRVSVSVHARALFLKVRASDTCTSTCRYVSACLLCSVEVAFLAAFCTEMFLTYFCASNSSFFIR